MSGLIWCGAAKECPVLKDQPAILKELCEYLQSDGDALAECNLAVMDGTGTNCWNFLKVAV